MLPFQLAGISMADEASKTLGGGIRNYLGTLGFILPLVGLEEFVRSLVSDQPALPHWASFTLIVAGLPLYVAPWAWDRLQWVVGREDATKGLEYLSHRDSELGDAVFKMAYKSAWGRWYAAQHLVNAGKPIDEQLLRIASSIVTDKITDGELAVRGRLPNEMDYQIIPQTYWRSSVLHFIKDPICLWKLLIIPRGGVEIDADGTIEATDAVAHRRSSLIANYDSLLVDGPQFERLWPTKDRVADKKRRRLLRRAQWRRLDKDEIQRLSGKWQFQLFRIAGLFRL